MKHLLDRKSVSGILLVGLFFIVISCGPKWTEKDQNGIMIVDNKDGQTLGYSSKSGVKILTFDRWIQRSE